jgi:hypothetical protein
MACWRLAVIVSFKFNVVKVEQQKKTPRAYKVCSQASTNNSCNVFCVHPFNLIAHVFSRGGVQVWMSCVRLPQRGQKLRSCPGSAKASSRTSVAKASRHPNSPLQVQSRMPASCAISMIVRLRHVISYPSLRGTVV